MSLVKRKDHGMNSEASVMKSTVINSSKEMTAYSDFPPDDETANFMHNTHMCKYLEEYAKEFDLATYIQFQHRVCYSRSFFTP